MGPDGAGHVLADTCRERTSSSLSCGRVQDGKEILDAVTGYKKAPLADAVKKLEGL